MRLTLLSLAQRRIRGHLFRGKYRLVQQVTPKLRQELIIDYETQENNMLLLRHPYLTLEQSSGHAKAFDKHGQFLKKWQEAKTSWKMKPHITLEDRLFHMKCKEAWE